MQHVVQQADAVHQQINSITALLEQFNARRAGLLREASRRDSEFLHPQSKPCTLVSESPQNPWSRSGLPIARLPTEVLDLVISCLNRNDLARVASSHKTLYPIASRIMYNNITINVSLQSMRCMKTLIKHPHLASLVRLFTIQWPSLSTPTRNLHQLAQDTLHALTAITSLSVDVGNDFPPWNLQNCTFTLSSLNTSFRFEQILVQFLESQPCITELTLRGFNSDPSQFSFSATTFNLNPRDITASLTLKPTALPLLSKVSAIHAGPNIMGTIIKGRPVKSVVMPLYADCSSKSLDAIASSSSPIERLNIMSFDPNAANYLLTEIAKRFKDLEALAIVLLLAECSEQALEAAASSLSNFSRLRYITFMSASPRARISDNVEKRIAKSWHAHCPTLKTIILPMGNTFESLSDIPALLLPVQYRYLTPRIPDYFSYGYMLY
uniref:F-box domain-containing protein n=1 Tax=Moniliophthora roreri TaxID=221103 RepID=A0A0W0G5M1_MONRR